MVKTDTMSAELKPLYANLKRLNFGKYLASREFEIYSTEKDIDEKWKSALRQIRSSRAVFNNLVESYKDQEEAFFLLLKWADANVLISFEDFLTNILLAFAEYSPYKVDFSRVYENLKDLGFSKATLLSFNVTLRQISASKATLDLSNTVVENNTTVLNSNKVFIVHGHDEVSRLDLVNLLKDEFQLEPIVLQEQPNKSIDLIFTKFERLAKECSIAIILMTPDDNVNENSRARQNVIFELGYFLGMWQNDSNRKIIVLKKGNLEIPSDISGVLYMHYSNKVKEIYLDLKKQLDHWGYRK